MKASEVSEKAVSAEPSLTSISVVPFESLPILLVENGRHKTEFVRSAFNEARIGNPLHIVNQGEEAISYLAGIGELGAPNSRLPAFMWLGIELPSMDGFEVLAWTRRQPHLRDLVIVILSDTGRMEDADRAYNLGADYFLMKPALFEEWVERIQNLHEWLLLCHHNRRLRSLGKHSASKLDK